LWNKTGGCFTLGRPGDKRTAPAIALAGLCHCWRRDPESNRAKRICNPLHNRFAIAPKHKGKGSLKLPFLQTGAGKESRTLDLNLGKVALYQLSYARISSLEL
jgi:hypothetical protein